MDEDGIAQAANYMPAFPLIGGLIGLATGAIVWSLQTFLPSLIAGMLGLGFVLLLTGVHHADGLLDFGDALMALGPPAEKLQVMRDRQTGAGGLCLGLVVLSTTAFSISALDRSVVIQSLVASEASCKFAMVLQAWAGNPAHEGLNSPFVEAMHGKWRAARLGVAFFLTLVISMITLKIVGTVVMLSALAVAMIVLLISKKEFGGVTGDVMGATNELTRLASLLVILVAAKWL
jgi:adenosylcobinamide-GDP ribazoletransferase